MAEQIYLFFRPKLIVLGNIRTCTEVYTSFFIFIVQNQFQKIFTQSFQKHQLDLGY